MFADPRRESPIPLAPSDDKEPTHSTPPDGMPRDLTLTPSLGRTQEEVRARYLKSSSEPHSRGDREYGGSIQSVFKSLPAGQVDPNTPLSEHQWKEERTVVRVADAGGSPSYVADTLGNGVGSHGLEAAGAVSAVFKPLVADKHKGKASISGHGGGPFKGWYA